MFWQCERCFVSVCLFSSYYTQTFFFFDESIARFGGWLGFWWDPWHKDIRIDICITWIRTWSIISVENMALKFLRRCCHIRCVLTFLLVFSEFNTCAVLMKLATEKIYWPHFTDGNGEHVSDVSSPRMKSCLVPWFLFSSPFCCLCRPSIASLQRPTLGPGVFHWYQRKVIKRKEKATKWVLK